MIDKVVGRIMRLFDRQLLPQQVWDTIYEVRRRNLTYLSTSKLGALISSSLSVEREGVPGIMIEAGCALGGSAIILASVKQRSRKLFVYDVFDTIPQPSDKDGDDVHERYEIIRSGKSSGINGDPYYGYVDNLYDKVVSSFEELGYPPEKYHVSLVKGLLQDTLEVKEPVSFAHIDVDWYEPVMTCLERIEPNLSIGGYMIIDDYSDWSGCRRAVNEYFDEAKVSRYELDDSPGSLIIRRRR